MLNPFFRKFTFQRSQFFVHNFFQISSWYGPRKKSNHINLKHTLVKRGYTPSMILKKNPQLSFAVISVYRLRKFFFCIIKANPKKSFVDWLTTRVRCLDRTAKLVSRKTLCISLFFLSDARPNTKAYKTYLATCTANLALPLLLLLEMSFRPSLVFILLLKPCVLARLILLGW